MLNRFKTLEFVVVECCSCHVQFCITERHRLKLLATKKLFYCPAGHPQSYTGKSDMQVIKELNRKIDYCSIAKNKLIDELESKYKSIHSYKMLLAKEKKKRGKKRNKK